MRKSYLADVFSLNMLSEFPAEILVVNLDKEKFCSSLKLELEYGNIENIMRYSNSAKVVNYLCGTRFRKNEAEVRLNKGDMVLVVLPKIKIDKDSELTDEVVKSLYEKGRVKFYKVLI
jgi:translation initiation factor IF-1